MSQTLLEQLSPSQIVLLRAETFVQKWKKLELPNGIIVSSSDLGKTLIKIALLACADQGVLELQIQPQQVLFGLQTTQILLAEPQETPIPWPQSTLEAWLAHLAAQLRPEERHRVQTLVYVLLKENHPNPWRQIVEKVQGGLMALGILEQGSQDASQPRVQVATSVSDSVANLPTDHLQEYLKSYRLASPQTWRLLHKEISRAVGYRKRAAKKREIGLLDYWIPC
ncbi:MAG: hypothetical protein GY832_10835 [Chloroflexi bacterium]|nr:hypothetical protein [Chloroflexota bacterium]